MGLQERIQGPVRFIFKLIDLACKRPLIAAVVLIASLALFLVFSYEAVHLSSSPGFCQMCHPGTTTGPLSEVHTWKQNVHAKAGVSCLDCHGRPGAAGYMMAKMSGLVDLYGELFKSKEHKMEILTKASTDAAYAAKLVPNETCLFCHSDESNKKTRSDTTMSVGVNFRLLDTVKNPDFRKSKGLTDIITEGVKPATDVEPNHKKHVDMGLSCADCHLGVAHAGQFKNKTKMQTCFDCHDKLRTSAMPGNNDCSSCHRKLDNVIPKAPVVFGSGKSAVKFSHDSHGSMLKCADCHTGIFQMAKGKAKIGFADHKAGKLCFSCHNGKKAFAADKCTSCHGETPVPKTIPFKVSGMSNVAFGHASHAGMFGCADCHTKIFSYSRSGKVVSMQQMEKGKSCGACHNGKTSFSVAGDCDKCHK